MRQRASAASLAVSLALAGCGAGGHPPATIDGAKVFAQNCSGCHSLIGSESRHKQGGDLVGYRLSRRQLIEFTREMPARRALTSAQLGSVVDYVLRAQQRGSAP